MSTERPRVLEGATSDVAAEASGLAAILTRQAEALERTADAAESQAVATHRLVHEQRRTVALLGTLVLASPNGVSVLSDLVQGRDREKFAALAKFADEYADIDGESD